MNFSIIIPIKELNTMLEESVSAILGLYYDDYELIILPNELPASLPGYLKDEKIKVIASGKVSPAVKRDLGAKVSKGKYLAFIDDDAYPRSDWLNVAEMIFREKKSAAVCGPALTPKDNSISQKASGLFFETFLGGGGMSYRYKPARRSFYVDDYPTVNLIVSRESFFEVGGFDSSFWPGEDTKFCLDLLKNGHKIWYSNKLIVWHHRRKLFLPHLKQISAYGKHRGYFAKRFPETSFRVTYLIPTIFLLSNIILVFLSFFSIIFMKLWLILLAIYFTLSFFDVFTRTSNFFIGLLTVTTIFITHLTYGAMFLKGIFSKGFRSELR